jgi:hypothetical protein
MKKLIIKNWTSCISDHKTMKIICWEGQNIQKNEAVAPEEEEVCPEIIYCMLEQWLGNAATDSTILRILPSFLPTITTFPLAIKPCAFQTFSSILRQSVLPYFALMSFLTCRCKLDLGFPDVRLYFQILLKTFR